MTVDQSQGVQINTGEALNKLDGGMQHATGAHDGLFAPQNLELAAAELAIALAIGPHDDPTNFSLREAILELQDEAISHGDTFRIEDVLSDREKAFLPAARNIVGLTYQAALRGFDRRTQTRATQ